MTHPFQNPDSWSGGTFDALMYFGPASITETLRISETIWRYARLNGPYRERHLLPSQQEKVTPDYTDDGCEQLVGEFHHQNNAVSPFVHTTIRDDDGLWIYCGIPMAGFPPDLDVGAYPFDDGKPVEWVIDFTNQLQTFTDYVRIHHSMLAAAFGWFDISILDTLDDAMNGKIHDDRWHQIELATENGWQVYPITKLEPLFTNA